MSTILCVHSILCRFTRPENLGSESKIKCNKCRSYQVEITIQSYFVKVISFILGRNQLNA